MLGTLVQGRVCVGGAGDQRGEGRADHRDPVRRPAPAVRGDRPGEEQLLLDYGMHQRRLLPLLARTYALHFAQEVRGRRAARRCSPARPTTEREPAGALESRAAGTKALGTWHATRTIQECREACGGAGYLSINRFAALQGRHGRVHHVRGRQPRAAAAGRQGAAHRLLQRVRGPRPARHGRGSSPGWRSRPWSSGPACTSCSSGSATCCPAATTWDQEAGLLDPNYQLAMLRFREEHMLAGVARRLKRGIDDGHEPGRGVLPGPGPRDRAPPARTSSGWCSRRSSRRSPRARRRRHQGRARPALRPARAQRRSRPTAPGSWSTAGCRAARVQGDQPARSTTLCRKIRPIAVDLVDAFGVPRGDAALARPGGAFSFTSYQMNLALTSRYFAR